MLKNIPLTCWLLLFYFFLLKKRKKRYERKILNLLSPWGLLVIMIREEVRGNGGKDGWHTVSVGGHRSGVMEWCWVHDKLVLILGYMTNGFSFNSSK